MFFIVILTPGFFWGAQNVTAGTIFTEIERIELDFENVIFAKILDIAAAPDGFLIIASESAHTDKHTLLKFGMDGMLIAKYNRRGNGPGELRYVRGIVAIKDKIFASESAAPFVHEFSQNLKFTKDHRIKNGGKILLLGKYFGIWRPVYENESEKKRASMISLYDRKTFKFKRNVFKVEEIPNFVYDWGGICKLDENTYAGIYVIPYQISLFDAEFQLKKKLLGKVPQYMKKYRPWKQNPQRIDNAAREWVHSWSKITQIYCSDGIFIIQYTHDKKDYLDFVSPEGNVLFENYEEKKNRRVTLTTKNAVWLYEWNDDRTRHTLIKGKLNIKKRKHSI